MKRVNIELKEEIHKQAKIISVLKNSNLSLYLQKAIEEAVARDNKVIKKIEEKLKENEK